MPYVPVNVPYTGTMDASKVTTDLAAARTWLNAIPAADLVDAEVRAEHLFRPEAFPFPRSDTRGDFQEAGAVHVSNRERLPTFAAFAVGGTSVPWWSHWSGITDRLTIYLDQLKPTQNPISGLCRRIPIERTCDIQVDVSMETALLTLGASFHYPTTIDGAVAGEMYLAYKSAADATRTWLLLAGTKRKVYPQSVSGALAVPADWGVCMGAVIEDVPPGTYDIAVLLDLQTTPPANTQLVIGARNMVHEIYKV